ncbi:DUF120 domain-containing protein [Candidatus Thalassarchaeum betae]|nr:CTP-dependent riboflavin kinase [Candidatus Thalassoarchaea betae]
MHLRGVVSSGLGRAHVFMAQPHYQNQFKAVLGAGAWPGTLNIELYGDNLADYRSLRVLSGLDEGERIEGAEPLRIRGFERDGRSFGGATAFKAEITRGGDEWIECAVLIPDLTRHTETAEVISPAFLREALPCEDGDEAVIRLS